MFEEFDPQTTEPHTSGEYVHSRKSSIRIVLFTRGISSKFYFNCGEPEKGLSGARWVKS